MSWRSESSTMEQDEFIRKLAREVLNRDLMSKDLHAAYEHAGVTRAPEKLPPNLKGYQAERLIDWLKHLRDEKSKEPVNTGPEPCIYCAFGCELCEGTEDT